MEKRGEGFPTMLLHYLHSRAIVGRKEGRKGEKEGNVGRTRGGNYWRKKMVPADDILFSDKRKKKERKWFGS